MKRPELSYLNYFARIIYNFWNKGYKSESEPEQSDLGKTLFPINSKLEKFVIDEDVNLFRLVKESLFGKVNRAFSCDCESISDAIVLKWLVDKSIVAEIAVIGQKNVCHPTYINCFAFPCFTSNIESYHFSKNGLRVAHVSSLSSYSQIDFSCFDAFMDNTQIQCILNNQSNFKEYIDHDKSLKLSQMISLFLCETSRNPTPFFTIPMCLELGELLFELQQKDIKKCITIISSVHSTSTVYLKLIQQRDGFKKEIEDSKASTSQDGKNRDQVKKMKANLSKIEVELSSKFVDIDILGIETILKSKIVKDVILSLFPLAMEKAVPASRYISIKINEKLKQKDKQKNYIINMTMIWVVQGMQEICLILSSNYLNYISSMY